MQVCRPGYDGNCADMQKSPDSRMHRLKFPMLELCSWILSKQRKNCLSVKRMRD